MPLTDVAAGYMRGGAIVKIQYILRRQRAVVDADVVDEAIIPARPSQRFSSYFKRI